MKVGNLIPIGNIYYGEVQTNATRPKETYNLRKKWSKKFE